jgi:hypothetical protein
MESTVPKVVSVEVVAAQPTDTDRMMIGQLAAEAKRPMSETAFIVKVRLEKIPPATGHGWALYVGDTRIPKYWEYAGGIYFKVLDEEFLAGHQGERLRFSENGADFVDTGARLPSPGTLRDMPMQSEVLADSAPGRPARTRAVRKRARPARAKAVKGARKRKPGRSK